MSKELPEYRKSESPETIMAETESLLRLAEGSTEAIDKLNERIGDLKRQFIPFLIGVNFFMAILASVFAVYSQGYYASEFAGSFSALPPNSLFLLVGAFSFFLVIVGAVAWGVASRKKQEHRWSRELMIEMDVHDRLISLLHEQIQRAAYSGRVSDITLAMYSIRARRLDR